MSLNSCDIDDIKPQNALVEDTVIRDEASALNVLNRIYTTYRSGNSGLPFTDTRFSYLISAAGQELTLTNTNEVAQHNVLDNNSDIAQVYQREYLTINTANFFIE